MATLKELTVKKLLMRNEFNVSEEGLIKFIGECHLQTYKKGDTIISAGDQADVLYFITDGSARVSIIDESGKELIIAQLSSGDFIGELCIFEEKYCERSAWVIAKGICEVAKIKYEKFHSIRDRHPEILYQIGSQLVKRLKATTSKLGDHAFAEVVTRVYRCLIELSEQPEAMSHPDGKQIKVTRQDLGLMAGCSREMAGRVMKDLEEDGLIQSSGKTVVLLAQN